MNLKDARRSGIIRGVLTGVSGGLTFGIMFGVYGLAFWFGVKLIMDDVESEDCQFCGAQFMNTSSMPDYIDCLADCQRYVAGDILVVFFSVLIGGMQIGQAGPYGEALATARSAAASIYDVIDRKPPIDSSSEEGQKPSSLEGRVSFKNIFFN